ncbi:PKD domain-containing protein, partial [Endozoicomonas acroporae]|uniref:PKD domain-containing protein n=1 Tax=Endozoicomonas acroporae TaxID=1701104 RepID=UPI003D793344
MTRRISSCTGNTRGASSFKRTSVALLLSCLTVTMATSFSGLAAAAPWEQGKIAIELLTNGVDADTPDGPSFPVGTPVVWEYLISNPGSQTLYNLVIYNQDTRSVFNLPKRICKVASLQPGDTTTCRKTGTVEEGSFQNRGRVVAYGKKPWRFWNWSLDEDYSHYQGRLGIPSVALESLINGEDADEPKGAEYYEGSSITKKYKIHNTGELNLTDLVITENQLAPSVASREVCKISSLAVGEKQECKLLEIAGLGEFKLESIVRATSIHGQIVEAIDLSHFQGKAKFSASPEATPSIGNAPLKVVFKPTVVTDSAIERYEWDFDSNGTWDRSETVGRNQQWTYSTPGKYVAKLRITDSKGQQTIGNVEVTVNNKPPVVSAEANPSNGAIPLTVNFNTTASDSDGISQYEWDFDGDGNFEQTSISGTIQFTYTSIGIYKPAVKVTDNQGFSTTLQVPTIEVQALGEGAPTVTATATTVAGNAPLSVGLSASLGNVSGAVSLWQWDFDGDGNFDFESTKSPSVNHIYTAVGSHYPMVRLTTDNGFTVEDRIKIAVTPKVSLSRSLDTIDPGLSETSTINTSLGGDTRIQLQIETSGGDVVKTLVPWEDRTAGKYTDSWDGTNDQGNTVPEGDYRAILLYELDDAVNRYDLSLTTGGGQYNPPRSR